MHCEVHLMYCGVRFLLCRVFNYTFPLLTVHVLVFKLYPATPLSRSVLFVEVALHTYQKNCQFLNALPGNPYAPVDPALLGSTVLRTSLF